MIHETLTENIIMGLTTNLNFQIIIAKLMLNVTKE